MNIQELSKCKVGDIVLDTSSNKLGKITCMVVGPSLLASEIHVKNGSDNDFSMFPGDYEPVSIRDEYPAEWYGLSGN